MANRIKIARGGAAWKFIIENLGVITADELALKFRVSSDTINRIANEQGMSTATEKPRWTSEEDALFRQGLTVKKIAALTGRTVGSVYQRRRLIGETEKDQQLFQLFKNMRKKSAVKFTPAELRKLAEGVTQGRWSDADHVSLVKAALNQAADSVLIKPHHQRELVNELVETARLYEGTGALRNALGRVVRQKLEELTK